MSNSEQRDVTALTFQSPELAALVEFAREHPSVTWRLEGSADWAKTLGKLMLEVEIPEGDFDGTYDLLNECYDERGERVYP